MCVYLLHGQWIYLVILYLFWKHLKKANKSVRADFDFGPWPKLAGWGLEGVIFRIGLFFIKYTSPGNQIFWTFYDMHHFHSTSGWGHTVSAWPPSTRNASSPWSLVLLDVKSHFGKHFTSQSNVLECIFECWDLNDSYGFCKGWDCSKSFGWNWIF